MPPSTSGTSDKQSSQSTHAPGWGVTLLGNPIDITAWVFALETPFDPWVEKVERTGSDTRFALRTASFDGLASADEVRAMALPLIERLNGAVLLMEAEELLGIGPVLRFRDDGLIDTTVFAEPGRLRLRGGIARAYSVTLGPDGLPLPPPPPHPSKAQSWATAAEQDDDIADLLTHFGRAKGDWYEIYKALEVATRLGNRHGGYASLLDGRAREVEAMRTTANFYRHARRGTYRPPQLTSMEEAKPLLEFVVKQVLNAAVPKPGRRRTRSRCR